MNELNTVKELVYEPCGLALCDLKKNAEGEAYGACSFTLNGRPIQYRVAKITPNKVGQFVAIWKRSKGGITEPYDQEDELDFIIITARKDEQWGQFIFPKSLLVDKGIISSPQQGGKRGIRVYPPWDQAPNKQAAKSQAWQTAYFLRITEDEAIDLDLIKRLFSPTEDNS